MEKLNVHHKLYEMIYPANTPIPNRVNDFYIGGVRLRDVPESIDEFYRLLFASFQKKWGWLKLFNINPSEVFKKERFISLSEFQEIFTKRNGEFEKLREKYPIYRLANIGSHSQQDDFIRAYETQNLQGYFYLMQKKNKKMWDIFHQWHDVYIPKKEKGRHTYIIGKSGCGKSELMKNLIIQDIKKNDSCVILIEPGGDLSLEVARQKELDKDRLIYVDLSLTPCTPSINPFEQITNRNDLMLIELQSQVIRDTLVQIFETQGQPFTAQMQSVLQPCLDVILSMEKATFYDLQKFASDEQNKTLHELGTKHEKHHEFFTHRFYGSNLKESKNGIYQKVQNLVNLSCVSDFFCNQTTIDLNKAIEEKKVIIFNLSKGLLGVYGSTYLGRLIVAILQNIIFQRAKEDKKDRTKINFFIDEFQDFINKSMKEIFEQGRRYGVNLTVATQTVGQGMGNEMEKAVLSNTNIKFAGQNDYRNTKTMSNETGVELEVLQNLQVGEFLTRIGNSKGFVLTNTKRYLDDTNCISKEEWNKVMQEQIHKYYKPRNKPPEPPTQENNIPKGGKPTHPPSNQERYNVPFNKKKKDK